MTRKNIAIAIFLLGAFRLSCSGVSYWLEIKTASHLAVADILVVMAVLAVAMAFWINHTERMFWPLFGGCIADLGPRIQFMYLKFIQIPRTLGGPWTAERREDFIWWSVLEILPGIALWVAILYFVWKSSINVGPRENTASA